MWVLLGGEGQMWVPTACLPPGPYQWGAHLHQPLPSPRFGPGPLHHPPTRNSRCPGRHTPLLPHPCSPATPSLPLPGMSHQVRFCLRGHTGVCSLAMAAVRHKSSFIPASEHCPASLVLSARSRAAPFWCCSACIEAAPYAQLCSSYAAFSIILCLSARLEPAFARCGID